LKWTGVIVLASLAACSSQGAAPLGPNICWRMLKGADEKPRFDIVGRDVPNLESCAVRLEGARLMEGGPISGAYNGHFIFATAEQITAARRMDGVRVRVFEAEDRREIQAGLRMLIERQAAVISPESPSSTE